jgi:signal transduction histidine kinase
MDTASLFGLVGFFFGIVLHIFLLLLVLKRKRRTFETLLISLLTGLLIWYAGNFVSLLLRQMDIAKVAGVLKWFDIAAFTGLSFLPALMLHTHWIYYQNHFDAGLKETRVFRLLIWILYAQLLMLPLALSRLFVDPSIQPLQNLGPFTMPFLVLLSLSYYSCCVLQIRIVQRSSNPVEKDVFKRLAVFFTLIPPFNFWVFGLGGHQAEVFGPFLENLALLASLFPTFLVAYYIHQRGFLQITVHRSVASAILVLLTILAYLAGIRSFGLYLEEELGAPTLLLEGTFLVTLLLFFPPLSRWVQNWVSRSFTVELRRYRRLADRISRSSSTFLSTAALSDFIEQELRTGLPAVQVKIHVRKPKETESSTSVYTLRSGNKRVGFLELKTPEGEIGPGQKEGIRLLTNEVAAALERSQLLEKQLAMERELEKRSHLEDLGRMAATIAHNVKNPLSSIKTLMQLQSEADNLTEGQKREIEMMTQEVDRLAKTVSTLLRFSSLGRESPRNDQAEEVNLEHLTASVGAVFRGDMDSRRLKLETRVGGDPPVVKSHGEALKDILSNLLSNAIEASPEGGTVWIEFSHNERQLVLTVADEGPGIPQQIRHRVGDSFFTTKSKGTGLGLAIVKRRSEQLGGQLSILNPDFGKGTRIMVSIPLTESHNTS